MNELRNVLFHHRKKFFHLENVVGIGRGYKEIGGIRTNEESIQVLVREKLPLNQLSQKDLIPKLLNGYPTDVIQVGELQSLAAMRTQRLRPAQPGVSIGHYEITAGTFGAVVYDQKTGQPLILSNNHVLANNSSPDRQRAKQGDPILQPGPYDGGTIKDDLIAHLERYVPIRMKSTEQISSFERSLANLRRLLLNAILSGYQYKMIRKEKENVVDCAVASPVDEEMINDVILEIGKIAGVRTPNLDEVLQKSGRTTGLTQGKVKTLDATVNVNMGSGEEAVFTDQILVEAISTGGDSGSLVLDENRNAVGLLFAGSDEVTVCNPIQKVLDALEVTF